MGGHQQSAGRPQLTTVAVDAVIDMNMRTLAVDYYSEQYESLTAEVLDMSVRHQSLIDDICSMKAQAADIDAKISTVDNILTREQSLIATYMDKIAVHREAVGSAEMYIRNIRQRIANIDVDRRAKDCEYTDKHRSTTAAIGDLREQLAIVRTEMEESQEERDDLMGKLQAKVAIQRQMDIESMY